MLTAYCLLICACENHQKSPLTKSTSPGQDVFEENCTSCHGSDGKLCVLGAKDLGISILDKPQMIEIITNGKNTMTPFGTMLSKEQIDALADYVQTLGK